MLIDEKIIQMLGESLGYDPKTILKRLRLVEDLGADSLDKIELMMDIEEEFKIPEISDEAREEWKTVQDVIDAVRSHSLAAEKTS